MTEEDVIVGFGGGLVGGLGAGLGGAGLGAGAFGAGEFLLFFYILFYGFAVICSGFWQVVICWSLITFVALTTVVTVLLSGYLLRILPWLFFRRLGAILFSSDLNFTTVYSGYIKAGDPPCFFGFWI